MRMQFEELKGADKIITNVSDKDHYTEKARKTCSLINTDVENLERIKFLMKYRKAMTDEEFISYLAPIAKYKLQENDLLRISSFMNKEKYVSFNSIVVGTSVDYTSVYACAMTENVCYDPGKAYHANSIYEAVKDKQVVLLANMGANQILFDYNVPVNCYLTNDDYLDLKKYYDGSINYYEKAFYKYMRYHISKKMLERELYSYGGQVYDVLADFDKKVLDGTLDDEYIYILDDMMRDHNFKRRILKVLR